MMNPTRFCGALFLFFFSAIAAVWAGQSKPSAPAGQPVNLFKEILDHKGQIQWKSAPPPGIPADVCLLFKFARTKERQSWLLCRAGLREANRWEEAYS